MFINERVANDFYTSIQRLIVFIETGHVLSYNDEEKSITWKWFQTYIFILHSFVFINIKILISPWKISSHLYEKEIKTLETFEFKYIFFPRGVRHFQYRSIIFMVAHVCLVTEYKFIPSSFPSLTHVERKARIFHRDPVPPSIQGKNP